MTKPEESDVPTTVYRNEVELKNGYTFPKFGKDETVVVIVPANS